jgi:pentatricopeptide repeat protein
LSAYTQARDPHGAEAFLLQLEEQAQKGHASSPPDVVMYNIVLNAWAKAKNGSRARQLLEGMTAKKVPPNTISYNTTINAHVRKGKMKRSERLARELVELYRSTGSPRPDLATFRSLLAGWTQSRDPRAAERAEQVLIWMRELHQEGILEDLPDSRCYQMVLDTCTKSSMRGSGAVAERTLREMIKNSDVASLTASHFAKVIQASHPERAAILLQEMYNLFLQGHQQLKPTAEIFWTVLKGLAGSGITDRADSVLRQMKNLHQSGRLDSAKPMKQAYDLVLQSWAKGNDPRAGKRAESLLRTMQAQYLDSNDGSVQPTMESYRAVLMALSKKTISVSHVENVFQELFEAYCATKEDNLKPDTACFNAVLVAYRSANDVPRAQAFLSQIEEWNDSGVLDKRPTVSTYNLVLSCMAYRGLAEECDSILQRMAERGIRPDAVSYNTVMHAWANSQHPDAVTQVESLMGSMKVPPDAMTYSTWLKSIAASSLSDRMDRAERVVALMKQQGFVPNARDLKQLEFAGGGNRKFLDERQRQRSQEG